MMNTFKRQTSKKHEVPKTVRPARPQHDHEISDELDGLIPQTKSVNLSLRIAINFSAAAVCVAAATMLLYLSAVYSNDTYWLACCFPLCATAAFILFLAQLICMFAQAQIGSKGCVALGILTSLPGFFLIPIVLREADAVIAMESVSGLPNQTFWLVFICFCVWGSSVAFFLNFLRTVAENACDPMIRGDSMWVFNLFALTVVVILAGIYANQLLLPRIIARGIPLAPQAIRAMLPIGGFFAIVTSAMSLVFFSRLKSEVKTMILNDREPQWYDELITFFIR